MKDNNKVSDRAKLAMEQWRREKPELDLLPMEVLGRLGEAAHLVRSKHLEPLFAKFGLQGGEFDVIATLRRSGTPYTLTPTQLYSATMISSGGMTNRIDRLEQMGLIKRKPNPDDRRGTLVALSARGLKLIDKIIPLHLENERIALRALGKNEQMELNGLLAKLIGGLG
ncbi:MAG: MarR family transcriptional regulator [Rhizobiaceae bacterium]|nr:MarR family transcriptional regulator [Rhizobiaceae bacterium]